MVELLPESRSIGLLFADSGETRSQVSAITDAAAILRRDVFTVDAADGNFTGAFAAVLRRGASGAISLAHPPFMHPPFVARRHILIQAAAAARVPVCFPNRAYTDDGGLISYGPDFATAFRRSGVLVARILRGQPIETLPMERPTRFELVLNLRAARAQGINVPLSIQQRADEVID